VVAVLNFDVSVLLGHVAHLAAFLLLVLIVLDSFEALRLGITRVRLVELLNHVVVIEARLHRFLLFFHLSIVELALLLLLVQLDEVGRLKFTAVAVALR